MVTDGVVNECDELGSRGGNDASTRPELVKTARGCSVLGVQCIEY